MKLIKILQIIFILAFNHCSSSLAQTALQQFLTHQDQAFEYQLQMSGISAAKINVQRYLLTSQIWPQTTTINIPQTLWQHQLTIYRPLTATNDSILLYVTGGQLTGRHGEKLHLRSKAQLDYEQLAQQSNSIVAVLEDVPNQYLFCAEEPLKEDALIAYTYLRVLENPHKNADLNLLFPMTKAIVKALDALTQILDLKKPSFVLAGASKRGWAVWLAALMDARVTALIPMMIDILNTKEVLTHICQVYQGYPPALNAYAKYDFVAKLQTTAGKQLLHMIDPLQYIENTRLAIPKLIISASGDDFFTPDATHYFVNQLPGQQNYLRYLPNALHYFSGNFISDRTGSATAINQSIINFLLLLKKQATFPEITWHYSEESGKPRIQIDSSIPAEKINIWFAHSDTRDFRYLRNYSRLHLLSKKIATWLHLPLCDSCYFNKTVSPIGKHYTIDLTTLPLQNQKAKWQAAFIELTYQIAGIPWIVTTPVWITAL